MASASPAWSAPAAPARLGKRCAKRSGGIPRPSSSSTSPSTISMRLGAASLAGSGASTTTGTNPARAPVHRLRTVRQEARLPVPQVRRARYRAGASHRPRRRAWSTSSLRAPRMIPACAQRTVQHFLSRGFVDESFGPSRALRAVWTARGQRWRVAHRLPPLACLSPTNSTGSATPCLQQRSTRKDRTAFVCSRHSRESHSPGSLTDARRPWTGAGGGPASSRSEA